MDGHGIVSAIQKGASGVQMGTAFLTTDESAASYPYKLALLSSRHNQTELTRAFTGKWARGLHNKFLLDMKTLHYSDIPEYPIQHVLTSVMRKEATEQQKTEYLSLWAGAGHAQCEAWTVKELIQRLKRQTTELGYNFND